MQKLLQLDPIAFVAVLAILAGIKFGVLPPLDTETILMMAAVATGWRSYAEHAKKRDLAAILAELDAAKARAAELAAQLEPPALPEPPAEHPEG